MKIIRNIPDEQADLFIDAMAWKFFGEYSKTILDPKNSKQEIPNPENKTDWVNRLWDKMMIEMMDGYQDMLNMKSGKEAGIKIKLDITIPIKS